MTARTPGQAACETWQTRRLGVDRTGPWGALSQKARADWEAAAQAAIDWWHAERDLEPPRTITVPAPELAAADRATAEFRRQCSELAGELGAARAVVREMDAHIASGDDYADPAKRAGWRQRAGIGEGQ